jgi:SAM-dependent methyltransferase
MARQRTAQLAYSQLMDTMLDEEHRRGKAAKILAVLRHFLGRRDLAGLTVADVGCSAGYIADELAAAGGTVAGVDIDVPGLAGAQERFGGRVGFVCADGERLPFPDRSLDVAVYNHIYEHVVDPDAVMRELRRVLADDGVLYLGLGNRLGVVEPHYRLPFLSYLPPALADRYVRAFGRADHYHERFRTRPGLRRLVADFRVWDYTLPLLREPGRFASEDMVPGPVARLPRPALTALLPIVPTYIWVATPSDRAPAGDPLREPPARLGAPR